MSLDRDVPISEPHHGQSLGHILNKVGYAYTA